MTWLSVLQTQTDLFSCNIIDGIFHRAPRGTRANQEQWHQLPYTAHTSAHSRYFASSTMSGLKSESFPHTILRCTYGRSSWQLNTPDSSLQRKGGHHHLFVCSKDRVSRFYCMLPWINLLLERAPAQFGSLSKSCAQAKSGAQASLWALQSKKTHLALKYIYIGIVPTHSHTYHLYVPDIMIRELNIGVNSFLQLLYIPERHKKDFNVEDNQPSHSHTCVRIMWTNSREKCVMDALCVEQLYCYP